MNQRATNRRALTRRPFLLAAAPLLLLGLSACGADPDDTAGPDTSGAGAAGGACLEGATVCADFPTGTGGIESGPDGSVPVAGAVSVGIDGPFLMSGYYVATGGEARLCEVLEESLPPGCGGTSIRLDPAEVPEGVATSTEGDVTWSTEPVPVEGRIEGDVFVVGAP